MSKSAKKNGAAPEEGGSGKAGESRPAGWLFSVEGTCSGELDQAAEKLVDLCGHGKTGAACSRWDASNTFFELRLGKAKRIPASPRTLVLLYASDLLFRLRWEIVPAMEAGRAVVAAPYVQTAIGFGVTTGLPKEWLDELFSFAPRPDACFRLKEKHKNKESNDHGKAGAGFVDFCCARLSPVSPEWKLADLRGGILKYFDDLEEAGDIARLGKKLPKKLGKK